ncbi:hypothetical protein DUI87_23300 [Hirundo rustica rustica]|uniref:Uncharacterized protein n=1 Tax=Hirundo rustica rustica TaxID=333673 RepID=A0A3M0JHW2_HIRRU|nr:hypothetical protein DUI87_23300 [Hirundo rustica rustica]
MRMVNDLERKLYEEQLRSLGFPLAPIGLRERGVRILGAPLGLHYPDQGQGQLLTFLTTQTFLLILVPGIQALAPNPYWSYAVGVPIFDHVPCCSQIVVLIFWIDLGFDSLSCLVVVELLMLELDAAAVTTPALFTLFGTGGLCPAGCVAALSEMWPPSEPSSAAFSEVLCSVFTASEFMDCRVC